MRFSMIICGVDEAGRGSIIGPLVISGVTIDKKNVKKLKYPNFSNVVNLRGL